MSNKLNLIGLKFGRLTVLSELPERTKQGHVKVKCKCDCGNTVNVRSIALKSGETKSCGCLMKEIVSKSTSARQKTHGLSNSLTYSTHESMISRCNNPNNPRYYHYGGRGIKVCDRWLSFEKFLEDMGERPSKEFSIERINNNGNYEPGNCKWADYATQNNNKSTNVYISYMNDIYTIAELSRLLGVKYHTIRNRTVRKHIFIYE